MTRVMGVLNVTPDSFSDGGHWFDARAAIGHGQQLVEEGADILDVGGESTRPGARPVPEAEELRRVLPVTEALAASGVRVSIDTRKAAVARAAVRAGATIINDVSAALWPVAAELGVGWVAMHMPADPSVMQAHARYDDVVGEVRHYLLERANRARLAGVPEVWIDPGIGFGKTGRHNLLLLRHLDLLIGSGFPVIIGASRKTFLGRLAPQADGTPAPPLDRLEASIAVTAWAILQGVDTVRVHDVAPAVQAVRLAAAGGPASPADLATADPAGPTDAASTAGPTGPVNPTRLTDPTAQVHPPQPAAPIDPDPAAATPADLATASPATATPAHRSSPPVVISTPGGARR